MTDLNHTPTELDPLKREVLEWIIRLTSGAATKADAAALKLWRAQSPAHDAAFAEAVRLRRALRQAAHELAIDMPTTIGPALFSARDNSEPSDRHAPTGMRAPGFWWYRR